MKVLVTGGWGFIGRQVAAALAAAGHDVVRAGRPPSALVEKQATVVCDFGRDTAPSDWIPRLQGVDAVVNCAGILRERGSDRFESVHVATPAALYAACAQLRVRRIIQVSALGDPQDGEFIASKHRGDAILAEHDLDWVTLRPSVVFSPRGSYGGTSLLRAMAALPYLLPLPGDGQQPIQPVSAEDLSSLVVWLLANETVSRQVLAVVGPEVMTLERYLRLWRRWLGFPSPWCFKTPLFLVALAARVGEWTGRGPLGLTMYRMLTRGNTATSLPTAQYACGGHWVPNTVAEVLARDPSFVQDRWHARLYFIAPLLRLSLGVVWVTSGVVGFVTSSEHSRSLLAAAGVTRGAVPLVYGASLIDLVVGVLMLTGTRVAAVGGLMLISLATYTVFIGTTMPSMWLDPFGGLLKNLCLIPAVLTLMALAERK